MYTEEQPMTAQIRGLLVAAGAVTAVPLLAAAAFMSLAPGGRGGSVALVAWGLVEIGIVVALIRLLDPIRIHLDAETLAVSAGVFRSRTPLREVTSCRPIAWMRWGAAVRRPVRRYHYPQGPPTAVEVIAGSKQVRFSSRDPETVCQLIKKVTSNE